MVTNTFEERKHPWFEWFVFISNTNSSFKQTNFKEWRQKGKIREFKLEGRKLKN